jgi:RNA polymerase sigma-70 factor (ECF subfamily)
MMMVPWRRGSGPVVAEREQLLATLRERIVAYATFRLGRDNAEDLAQEVLLLLETKYPQVVKLEEMLPLAFQIIRFKISDFRRKAARRGEYDAVTVDALPLAGSGNVLADLERRELRLRLLEAVRHLDGRCREIFRMKLEGRSYAEIQAKLGASNVNTVYTWDHRCRRQLMVRLGVGERIV